MNKTANIRKLLAAAYCIPYAYLAVWGDGTHGTMIFIISIAAWLMQLIGFLLFTRRH